MNKIINSVKVKKQVCFIKIAVLVSVTAILGCYYDEIIYKNKINGIYYKQIHRLSGRLFISIKNIDTIPESALVNFIHCLHNRESENGRETELIEIYDVFNYIDQIDHKNLFIRVRLMPNITMDFTKKKAMFEYKRPPKIVEVDYEPINLKCNIE